jgi:hypothetical protein
MVFQSPAMTLSPNRFQATPKIPQNLAGNIAIAGGMLMPVDFYGC